MLPSELFDFISEYLNEKDASTLFFSLNENFRFTRWLFHTINFNINKYKYKMYTINCDIYGFKGLAHKSENIKYVKRNCQLKYIKLLKEYDNEEKTIANYNRDKFKNVLFVLDENNKKIIDFTKGLNMAKYFPSEWYSNNITTIFITKIESEFDLIERFDPHFDFNINDVNDSLTISRNIIDINNIDSIQTNMLYQIKFTSEQKITNLMEKSDSDSVSFYFIRYIDNKGQKEFYDQAIDYTDSIAYSTINENTKFTVETNKRVFNTSYAFVKKSLLTNFINYDPSSAYYLVSGPNMVRYVSDSKDSEIDAYNNNFDLFVEYKMNPEVTFFSSDSSFHFSDSSEKVYYNWERKDWNEINYYDNGRKIISISIGDDEYDNYRSYHMSHRVEDQRHEFLNHTFLDGRLPKFPKNELDRFGNKNGYWEFYTSDGKITSSGIYLSGMMVGLWFWFYPDGEHVLNVVWMSSNAPGGYYAKYDLEGEIEEDGIFSNGEKIEIYPKVSDRIVPTKFLDLCKENMIKMRDHTLVDSTIEMIKKEYNQKMFILGRVFGHWT